MEKVVIKDSTYRLKKAKILQTKKLTANEMLFEVALADGEVLDHEPGQFVMVSLLGIGEVPISVCSSPTKRSSFELCVRSVGKVTRSLHKLKAGDEIGIRGPYGKGFPIRILEGNDLLLIAGGLGLAPLRSLITYVLDNRRDFGKVHLLFGCKEPKEMLFSDELEKWNERTDLHYACTVDRAAPEWAGNVGVITTLIPGVDIEPARTFAAVVGPPVMYNFVIKELISKAIPARQILLSFERNMKCGNGKCGRCQIQNLYCCQDGPVFNYEKIKNLSEAI
ncbi:MAG: FAD/NAD(P)-binding protein [Thermodesulfovibrionales bacterium]|jgi:NAD(P)H-flavin reductase